YFFAKEAHVSRNDAKPAFCAASTNHGPVASTGWPSLPPRKSGTAKHSEPHPRRKLRRSRMFNVGRSRGGKTDLMVDLKYMSSAFFLARLRSNPSSRHRRLPVARRAVV